MEVRPTDPLVRAEPASQHLVRFTPADGVRGWLQARASGQRLHGSGMVEIVPGLIRLRGRQHTWLGTAVEGVLEASSTDIRAVASNGERVGFNFRAWRGLGRTCTIQLQSAEHVAAFLAELSRAGLYQRDQGYEAARAFEGDLRAATPRTYFTSAIALLNVLVFIAVAVASGSPLLLDPVVVIQAGANFGPRTTGGEWWRLLSSVFLHLNLLHLLFNTWALWGAGRLAERMFGNATFLLIYLATGAFASLASTLWDPMRTTAGASGAIFGVLGALLAYLIEGRTRLPRPLLKAYAPATAGFVLFNLVYGFFHPAIDNMAHTGGLVGGVALGWWLARPAARDLQRSREPGRTAVAGLAALLVLGAGGWYAQAHDLSVPERYWRTHAWYPPLEAKSFAILGRLEAESLAGAVSPETLREILERDVLPFWRDADERLAKESSPVDPEEERFAVLLSEFVRLRHEWVVASIEAFENTDRSRAADAAAYLESAERTRARISLLELRALADHPRGISRLPVVRKIRSTVTPGFWSCVGTSARRMRAASWPGYLRDGGGGRAAAACDVQRAFLRRDYAALDALLEHFHASRRDLLDRDSRLAGALDAVEGALARDYDWEDAFLRIGEWRRASPRSIWPRLFEIELLRQWAWFARGGGTAKTVSPLQWLAFGQRIEMASTALEECRDACAASPLWHELAIHLGIESALGAHTMRGIFETGIQDFPDYLPLYEGMLRNLLPRWHGSLEEAGDFIAGMSDRTEAWEPAELYARLFSSLAGMEEEETKLFERTSADWNRIRSGFEQMMLRYPDSISVVNRFAYMACRAGDVDAYRSVRDRAREPLVPSAWTSQLSFEKCDHELESGLDQEGAVE